MLSTIASPWPTWRLLPISCLVTNVVSFTFISTIWVWQGYSVLYGFDTKPLTSEKDMSLNKGGMVMSSQSPFADWYSNVWSVDRVKIKSFRARAEKLIFGFMNLRMVFILYSGYLLFIWSHQWTPCLLTALSSWPVVYYSQICILNIGFVNQNNRNIIYFIEYNYHCCVSL